jgi:hypothetical protein
LFQKLHTLLFRARIVSGSSFAFCSQFPHSIARASHSDFCHPDCIVLFIPLHRTFSLRICRGNNIHISSDNFLSCCAPAGAAHLHPNPLITILSSTAASTPPSHNTHPL